MDPTPQSTINPNTNQSTTQEKSTARKLLFVLIILAVIALIAVGIGLFITQNNQITSLEAQLKDQQQLLSSCQTQSTSEAADKDSSDASTTELSSDYIYIIEWGVKIKKPTNVYNISYKIQNGFSDGNSSLGLTGTINNQTYDTLPDYLNLSTMGLAGLSRSKQSFENNTPVTTINGYNYYYSGPQACYSTDANVCQNEEVPVAQAFEATLINPANYSEI